MEPNLEDRCVTRLTPGQSLRVRDATGCTIMCCAGTVWITQENDAREILLAAGQRFTFDRAGIALVCAVDGMQDLWTGNAGIAVICLPARLARRV